MVFHEKTISSEKKFDGQIIKVRVDKIRTKEGGESFREVVEHPGGVAIAALTKENKMILIKQFRKPAEQVLIEVPAGKMEKGEKPENTAIRELKEETGYKAGSLKHLCTFYSSPGFSDEKIYLYLAQDIVAGEASPDEHEHLEIEEYDLEILDEMIENEKIIDGKTIVAIYQVKKMMDCRRDG